MGEDEQLLALVRSGRRPAEAPRIAGLDRTPSACDTRARTLLRHAGEQPAWPQPPSSWSDQDNDALVAGYHQGLTLAELGELLGRHPAVVDDQIRRLREAGADVPQRRPRWTEARRQRLATRRSEGASLSTLEREFGLSRGSINAQLRTLKRLGLLGD